MQVFHWNHEKNRKLKAERGVSFEDILLAVITGNTIDVYDHPDQDKYPGQKIYVVSIDGTIYLVPFVSDEEGIFLKTIIPSRKAAKKYSGGT